ncbi:unnamed protein product [Phaedon cochleariae]|uniref:Poly(A)-specific ribonuclease RNA-binding domain-containing protein n=1 Tax=Phaedon cochleariae TaxID=80249 RepID=A0A9N9SDH8_PHACE|nr:unnamed protein product [Phaedon cochleariae]
MEVTISNFTKVLPEVEKAIQNCTFLSIDCELTGLNVTRNINSYDAPGQYYDKVRNNCKEFLVIQYGLSTFRYDSENDKFKQQSYNFYIFRRPMNRNIPDQRFLCQASSIHFLINQCFDFNKLFKEGIPYLNDEEVKKYRSNLEDNFKKRSDLIESQQNGGHEDIIPIPENAQDFIKDVIEKIETFLETEETELQLPKCNSFFRRLVYQLRTEKFAGKVSMETRQIDKDRVLFVTKLRTKEEEQEHEKKIFEGQLEELEGFIGFNKVLKMIVKSGKLVIGHNLCLDLLHTIEKFLCSLPCEYEEFKELAHGLFPRVIDTKYMSSTNPFPDLISSSVLNQLLERLSEKPFSIPNIEIEEGHSGYKILDNKEHEAGYDAYITGVAFLAMWKYLGSEQKLKDNEIFGNMDLLEPYMNRIYLMILTDNQYIHLGGEDSNPSRDHVFHITFPKDWRLNNITQLFSPFGNVHVSWIDETSAYVGLNKRDQAAIALNTLSQSDTIAITTYAKRQAFLSGTKTPLSSPLGTRKRRKSSEGPPSSKKRRTDSFPSIISKRSIDRIEEERMEAEDGSTPGIYKKTFEVDTTWD